MARCRFVSTARFIPLHFSSNPTTSPGFLLQFTSRAEAATLFFHASSTTATAICLAPCYQIQMFYEDATRSLPLQALQFDIDVFGGAAAANLQIPPATGSNASAGNTSLEDAQGNIMVIPWALRGAVGASAEPGFDALVDLAGDAPFTVNSIKALRNAAVGCTPSGTCAIQLNGLGGNRVYLGRFNVTWYGGSVGVHVGTITGEGPGALDPVVGLARLSDSVFMIDGFPSPIDSDGDGWPDGGDNCLLVVNVDQADTDGDGIGDACNDVEDLDGDEWADALDNCPSEMNADQADRDLDLIGNVCDHCPDYPTTNNNDFDHNGIGDQCECGDQTGDAVVNVLDLLGINLAIFGSVQASPLCDTNNDGKCNVQDIVRANQKIFGRPAYCSRYPPPGP